MFGDVTDPSGAVIPGAKVTAHADSIGVTRTVTASGTGEFVIPNLPPATYTVTVESKGFKALKKEGVILNAADKLNAGQFALPVGTTDSQVTVTADAAQLQLQSNSGERSDIITSKQLNEVALNGRNVLDYMKLVPGVSGMYDGHASGTGGNDAFNINGTRANQHEYTIDGASNVDTGNNGGTHITINPDAIEEVKVLTSNYQAEYGKAAGGQIALTTKSGTNDWHGNGRFYHRHEGLNANEYFNKQAELAAGSDNEPAKYRYNYVGYSIGGPVLKNKLFFFWNQEYYRQYVPLGNTIQAYVPTALERQGDFSQSVRPGTDASGNAISVPVEISGPGIVGNKINRDALTPAQQSTFDNMQKILNLYPMPNVPGFAVNGQQYNYSTLPSAPDPRREDILRIDWQINNANRIYGRWAHNADTMTAPYTPFPGPFGIFACSAPEFNGGCTQKHPGWNFSVNLVSTITPTVLNEFSIGPSHTLSLAESNGGISSSALGVNLPVLYPGLTDTIPDVAFNGMNNVAFSNPYLGATPWKQANTTINVNDNLTWSYKNHTFKTGVFYQRNRKDQIAWGNINGQFGFDSGQTAPSGCDSNSLQCGDPIASALLGQFQSFSQSTARPVGKFRYDQWELYVQDTWKLTPTFTLDYGMRFAYIPPQYDANMQIALFDPNAYNPANAVELDGGGNIMPGTGDVYNGMRFTKMGDLPAGGWGSRGFMPEPRIGFAWDPFSNHKTVLRGGFGMMHDRVQGNLIFNPVFNNPVTVRTASLGSGSIEQFGGAPGFGNGVLGGVIGADLSGKVPTVYSFSLGVQREIGWGSTIDVAYVGSLSRHLVTSHDINAVPYGAAFERQNQDPNCDLSYEGGPNFGGTVPNVEPNLNPIYTAAGLSFSGLCAYGHPGYTDAFLVPYRGYGQIAYLDWGGTSNYNSLQVSFQKRYGKGLTFGAVYTYSKSLGTANSDQDTQDAFNALVDYRALSWDRTHVFAANYVYDIPGLAKHFNAPKWVGYITDNYQLSGVTNFQTGTPVDMGNNWSWEHGALTGGNMWGATQYYYTLDSSGNPVLPGIGPPPRGSRDQIRYGGLQNWDMSLFKNIPFHERYNIQLRLEAFNVFNHTNFSAAHWTINTNGPWEYSPNDALSITQGSDWGTPQSTYGTGPSGFRVVQLGARFSF